MSHPRRNSWLDFGDHRVSLVTLLCIRNGRAALAQPASRTNKARALNSTPTARKSEPEEWHLARRAMHPPLVWMKAKTLPAKQFRSAHPQLPQFTRVVTKNQEVVAIPDVLPPAEAVHDRMIEAIEKNIRQELAGEVADGNSPAAHRHREEVIAWEPLLDWFLWIAAIDDPVHHAKERHICHDPTNFTLQDLMVDARKELHHITLENESPSHHQTGCTQQRLVRTLSNTACI